MGSAWTPTSPSWEHCSCWTVLSLLLFCGCGWKAPSALQTLESHHHSDVPPCCHGTKCRFKAPRDQSENLPALASLTKASVWLQNQSKWRQTTLAEYNLQHASDAPAYTKDNTHLVSFSAPQVRALDANHLSASAFPPTPCPIFFALG